MEVIVSWKGLFLYVNIYFWSYTLQELGWIKVTARNPVFSWDTSSLPRHRFRENLPVHSFLGVSSFVSHLFFPPIFLALWQSLPGLICIFSSSLVSFCSPYLFRSLGEPLPNTLFFRIRVFSFVYLWLFLLCVVTCDPREVDFIIQIIQKSVLGLVYRLTSRPVCFLGWTRKSGVIVNCRWTEENINPPDNMTSPVMLTLSKIDLDKWEGTSKKAQLGEDLIWMGCIGLYEKPWVFQRRHAVVELLPLKAPRGVYRAKPQAWTRELWREVYTFAKKKEWKPKVDWELLESHLSSNYDASECYHIEQFKNKRLKKVVDGWTNGWETFFFPIFHPKQYERITALLATTYVQAFLGLSSPNRGVLLEETLAP